MDIGGREERVDAYFGRPFQGLPSPVDVFRTRPGKAADRRTLDLLRDTPDRFKIAGRTVREAGLDDIDAEPGQLFCDHDFFFNIHARARRLLSIPQRCIEDSDHARHMVTPSASKNTKALDR